MKQQNKPALKVGRPYLATDTNTVFVANQSDVDGAQLANSEHLYKEVEGPNVNAVKRNRARYATHKNFLKALTDAAKLDAAPSPTSEERGQDREPGQKPHIRETLSDAYHNAEYLEAGKEAIGEHTPGELWRDDSGFIAISSGDTYMTFADLDCNDADIDEREANKDRLIKIWNSYTSLIKENKKLKYKLEGTEAMNKEAHEKLQRSETKCQQQAKDIEECQTRLRDCVATLQRWSEHDPHSWDERDQLTMTEATELLNRLK